jgi:hypothetical protein
MRKTYLSFFFESGNTSRADRRIQKRIEADGAEIEQGRRGRDRFPAGTEGKGGDFASEADGASRTELAGVDPGGWQAADDPIRRPARAEIEDGWRQGPERGRGRLGRAKIEHGSA